MGLSFRGLTQSEAIENSGETIPTQGDGHERSQEARHLYSGGVPGI
jgi:hypothetical protein